MDCIKIGEFLKSLRRDKGLTQERLGEKLGVTNKTISRWETGVYLPPAEMLLELSKLYDVSINEILSGKRLSEEEYQTAAEENFISVIKKSGFSVKEKKEFFRKKWLKEHIGLMVFMGILIILQGILAWFTNDDLLFWLLPVTFVVMHCIRNNMMMSYIEKHIYSEK